MSCWGPGCSREADVRATGLCRPHHIQKRDKGSMAPLRNRGTKKVDHFVRNSQGHKQCGSCLEWLALDSFGACATAPTGLNYWCKGCHNAERRLRRYNLDEASYQAMIEVQGNQCANLGCRRETDRGLHVDHDHLCCPDRESSCGECIRGLLCGNCNTALGLIDDSVSVLLGLANYLTFYNTVFDARMGL